MFWICISTRSGHYRRPDIGHGPFIVVEYIIHSESLSGLLVAIDHRPDQIFTMQQAFYQDAGKVNT